MAATLGAWLARARLRACARACVRACVYLFYNLFSSHIDRGEVGAVLLGLRPEKKMRERGGREGGVRSMFFFFPGPRVKPGEAAALWRNVARVCVSLAPWDSKPLTR